MGFVLTILYFLTYYLTPTVIFGSLAAYRVELILALLVVVVSIPVLSGSIIGKTVQSLALIGLAAATFASVLVGQSWPGGGLTAFLLFVPNAFAYYLVCLHCRSRLKIQLLVLSMLFVCLFVIGNGAVEMHRGLPTGTGAEQVNMRNSYFLGMNNDKGQWFYRLRGKGEIDDPNDFAQLIVCVLPLLFIFWRKKKFVRNFVFVLVPVGILLWGAFETHSRGSILAILAVVIVAARRRIGTVPSLILAVGLFFGATALHFTGGREISASAGEDRTALWGDGLQLLKSHPLFGVGFGFMPEYAGQTAHNSIVVCGAELGLFGLYFWSLFLLPTVRDALAVSSADKVIEGEPVAVERSPYSYEPKKVKIPDREEINKIGRLLVLSFTGFLVASWFLSRAYVMTLFILGGMTEVLFQMAWQQGMISPRIPFGRVLRYSGVMMVGLVLVMYVTLRILNLTH
jgi:O-antigen ligase